jgi:hypothetical protein
MPNEESRTFLLDRVLVNELASDDYQSRRAALSELPSALTREEASGVAMQVSLVHGPDALKLGERLEKQVLFHMGATALIETGDLVTAESATKELRSRGDFVGFFMLANRLRKARRQIVQGLVDDL